MQQMQAGDSAEEALRLGVEDPGRFISEWEAVVPHVAWGHRWANTERWQRVVFSGETYGEGEDRMFFVVPELQEGQLRETDGFWLGWRHLRGEDGWPGSPLRCRLVPHEGRSEEAASQDEERARQREQAEANRGHRGGTWRRRGIMMAAHAAHGAQNEGEALEAEAEEEAGAKVFGVRRRSPRLLW
jgi:hypothetical protein